MTDSTRDSLADPAKDNYDNSHGSGNPHLQPRELQKVWHPADKPEKPKK